MATKLWAVASCGYLGMRVAHKCFSGTKPGAVLFIFRCLLFLGQFGTEPRVLINSGAHLDGQAARRRCHLMFRKTGSSQNRQDRPLAHYTQLDDTTFNLAFQPEIQTTCTVSQSGNAAQHSRDYSTHLVPTQSALRGSNVLLIPPIQPGQETLSHLSSASWHTREIQRK